MAPLDTNADTTTLELVSQDQLCVRTMNVKYTTDEKKVMQWRRSGHNFKCNLPSTIRDVEVTFSVVGGSRPCKVDRSSPKYPWVKNDKDEYELERFVYDECPKHVQYHICGPAWGSYIWHVFEQTEDDETDGFELCSPVPDNILPHEVLLHVPQPSDIKFGNTRMIFLNTPLEDSEQRQLAAMQEELKRQNKTAPCNQRHHLLRLLQQAKGDPRKAIVQMEKNMQSREKFMPLREDQMLQDLQKGAIYWHGRDFKCRPCLVIAAGRIDRDFIEGPERLCKVAVFLLELMLRYGMYPGRVENWGVIVDLEGAGQHGRPPIRLITDLVETLQGIFRFRMAWTKIINAPWWFAGLWAGVKKVIPGESAKKVEILSGAFAAPLLGLLHPSQLERRFGGAAKDLADAADFFPLRPSPGPFAVEAASAPGAAAAPPCSPPCGVDLGRLHELTTAESREGSLWVRGQEDTWLHLASRSVLTPSAAGYLMTEFSVRAAPCESLQQLLQHLTFQRLDSGRRWKSQYEECESDNIKISASISTIAPTNAPTSSSLGPMSAPTTSNKEVVFLPSVARAALSQQIAQPTDQTGPAYSPQADISAVKAPSARPRKSGDDKRPPRKAVLGAFFGCCSRPGVVHEPVKRTTG